MIETNLLLNELSSLLTVVMIFVFALCILQLLLVIMVSRK